MHVSNSWDRNKIVVSFHGILSGREMCILLPTDLKTYHNRYFIGTIFPTKIANFDNFAALAKIAHEFPIVIPFGNIVL